MNVNALHPTVNHGQEEADDAPEAAAAAPATKMKKSDAMREAIQRGIDKPQAAGGFIKSEFGLDVMPQMFSSFKSIGKQKSDAPSAVRVRRASASAAAAAAANGPRVGNGSPVELARQIKKLVDVYGVASVREMTTVFE